jgi:hypothetical protein
MAVSRVKTSSILQGFPKSRSLLAGNTAYLPYFALYGKSNDVAGTNSARQPYFDSASNVYFVATKTINKWNSGAVVWSKVSTSTNLGSLYDVALDPSNNVYVCGGSSAGILAEYNSSGTLQWQRTISDLSYYTNCVADSTDVYAVASQTASALGYLVKYNGSGTLQWQRLIGTTNNCYLDGIALDSSSNIYVVGRFNNIQKQCLLKFDSSGTNSFKKEITLGSSPNPLSNIVVSSTNNLYAVGWYSNNTSGQYEGVIYKFDTSGAITWSNKFTKSGTNIFTDYIALDSSENVYVVGNDSAGIVLLKYNSSGTLQWQRKITGTNNPGSGGVAITPGGDIVVSGSINNGTSTQIFQAYLPSDGSKTGTYTLGAISITYAVYTGSSAASGASIANSSQTISTPSYTSTTSTETDSSTTWTIVKAGL